jgi:hypothetical protein
MPLITNVTKTGPRTLDLTTAAGVFRLKAHARDSVSITTEEPFTINGIAYRIYYLELKKREVPEGANPWRIEGLGFRRVEGQEDPTHKARAWMWDLAEEIGGRLAQAPDILAAGEQASIAHQITRLEGDIAELRKTIQKKQDEITALKALQTA